MMPRSWAHRASSQPQALACRSPVVRMSGHP
jgi:hypothetical protein